MRSVMSSNCHDGKGHGAYRESRVCVCVGGGVVRFKEGDEYEEKIAFFG